MKFLLASTLAAALCLIAGCGSAARSQTGSNEGAGTRSGASGVEVFGTIDAAVSHRRSN
ncbi:hypothetical protein QTH89_26005 [Variovorax sp. J22G21]|uniref:hypothetical protein n=1 Tax=Variovorax fucosicus TaxID=3053517 RepID=UPI00257517C1|nr:MULTISPECIES: hypothetical protein [unclassified Variovorax]MDM0042727.1 hypothetical protein [Variovorax sp. J22R193]MDM0059396.1 hypothetical protein [Variovorax sp. J22G47]MDM0064695.1 hypothetical protein [Variovorax sp. J22G21]